ncbi:hypothetical protein EBZ37_07430, partial [bacterium]|nr:hypothetical protein [bacterium]
MVLLAFLGGTSAIAGESCNKSPGFREVFLGKFKTHQEKLCVRHPVYDFVSAKCLGKSGCEAVRKYRGSKESAEDFGPVGSPSHRKCIRLGG